MAPIQASNSSSSTSSIPGAPEAIKARLGGPADVVLSDMAANATGHRKTDHLKIIALAQAAAEFAREVLAPGGAFLCKVLQGGTEATLLASLKRDFASVRHLKPAASRTNRRSSICWRPAFVAARSPGGAVARWRRRNPGRRARPFPHSACAPCGLRSPDGAVARWRHGAIRGAAHPAFRSAPCGLRDCAFQWRSRLAIRPGLKWQ